MTGKGQEMIRSWAEPCFCGKAWNSSGPLVVREWHRSEQNMDLPCLFEKVFIPPSLLKDSFSGYKILGWQFHLPPPTPTPNILKMFILILFWMFCAEKSMGGLMGLSCI